MIERLMKIYQLGKRAFGNYKKSILLLTFLGLFNGVVAGVGINALIPIFSFAIGDDGVFGNDKISKLIQEFFVFLHIDFSLKYLLIFVCLLFVFQAVVVLLSNYLIAIITADYERHTRNLLFSKTVKAGWPYLLQQKLGHLETVLTNDVKFATVALTGISGLIITLSNLLIYILVAINISLIVTVLTFIFGLLYIFLTRPLLLKIKDAGRRSGNMSKDVAHLVNESVVGIKTIKVFSVENYISELAKKKFLVLRDLRVGVAFQSSISGAITQPLSVLFIAVIFAVFYKTSTFNIGAFLALVYLIQKIFVFFNQLQNTLQKIIEAIPYLQSVLSYQEKAREFREESGGNEHFVSGCNLTFNGVDFSYNTDNKQILHNINFSLNNGEVVGIIGPSGAGKTTIVDLILRLFLPVSGKIMLGENNINNINIKDWREKIGYVSQDLFLINDTIENNIRFYDDRLTADDIEMASKMADIHDFVMSKPDKFKTVVGERGVLLSGGQRQRVVIARVLARRPEILILDEATSALDNESESQIQRVINNLKGKMTVLIVAHRLSTVINCNRLLVLDGGIILEDGKPEDMLKNKDSYLYKVYNQ